MEDINYPKTPSYSNKTLHIHSINQFLPSLISNSSHTHSKMSFYIYYGKLDNELLVAVLPKGTIEEGDNIYLYTKSQNSKAPLFSECKTKNITVNGEGEDVFTFQDGSLSYEAVSEKDYTELSLTQKSADGKTFKAVALTRHYNQALTVSSSILSIRVRNIADLHLQTKGYPAVRLTQDLDWNCKGRVSHCRYTPGSRQQEACHLHVAVVQGCG
jgi:hypothetical protein